MTSKTRHLVSCVALTVIWQLVTLIPSVHAKTETHPTQDDSSDACTRAPETEGSTGSPVAHFPCLSFAPLSTTTAEPAFSLSFSLSAQETPWVLSSSVTVLQSFNSTSHHAVSTSTVYTTPRGNEQATSTFSPQQVHTVANATFSPNGAANTILSQNSTTDFRSSVPTTAFTQEGDGATNATIFPVVLQTVTYTTTICPSGGWV